MDLSDVIGLSEGRRALEIAAAGRHTVLFVGPPGCGRTMLARRLSGIMPPVSEADRESMVSTYSSARMTPPAGRPFRAPHHTVSAAGLRQEAVLARGGVLLLDEVMEFRQSMLDPLPEGPLVVAATNGCPCGWQGSGRPCVCPPESYRSWHARLDRIAGRFDLHATLRPARAPAVGASESSAEVQAGVVAALGRPAPEVPQGLSCAPRVLSVASTIARLDGAARVEPHHVEEAVRFQYSKQERVGV